MCSSTEWPARAAYASIAGRPRPVSGVILGSTAVKVISRPARFASSWAYPVMKRWVALAPAYPPLR